MTDQEFVTTYFPLDVVRDGLRGCCHQFAYALNRRTGWRLAVLWLDPVIDMHTVSPFPEPLHVFCLTPEDYAIDVEGLRTCDETIEQWRPWARRHRALRIETYADIETYERAMSASEPMLVPSDHAVACADKVIAGSKPFLALVAELNGHSDRLNIKAALVRLSRYKSLLTDLCPQDRAAVTADQGPEAAGVPGSCDLP